MLRSESFIQEILISIARIDLQDKNCREKLENVTKSQPYFIAKSVDESTPIYIDGDG